MSLWLALYSVIVVIVVCLLLLYAVVCCSCLLLFIVCLLLLFVVIPDVARLKMSSMILPFSEWASGGRIGRFVAIVQGCQT